MSPDKTEPEPVSDFDIAIVGAACRVPGAADLATYWSNLAEGKESIRRFSDDELRAAGVPDALIADRDYIKAAPVLDDPGRFDAAFFGYSPRDASLIDPQQRHLLELAWLAFEDAGIVPGQAGARTATFAGTAMNTYLLSTGLAQRFFEDYLPVLLGADKDFQATRIAFKLGLTGPAVSVQTACSTSLVAVHMACQSLINRESDLALAAAAAVRCPTVRGHRHEAASVFTRDGHCRPFDADASGTIFGSGGGALLLKRLSDAIADGDPVRAIIKGSAINNDGDAKADFTAPTVGQQAEAISEAMGSADVSADTIDYIEAHGTGTALGDPIEVAALQRAFAADTERRSYCGLGSVKSNIGHLDVAAGMASIIKVLLALEHETLPPTLHYRRANPQIDFANTPFRVIARREAWPRREASPRRAGVSSLGMGGTNAHVVLEEAPQAHAPAASERERPQLLQLSARDAAALDHRIADLADWLKQRPDAYLPGVAATLRTGRKTMAVRRVAVSANAVQAAEVLGSKQRLRLAGSPLKPAARDVLMMFPGQGSQRAGMARALYESDTVFRQAIERVCAALADEPDLDLLATLFPPAGSEPAADISETRLAQPALFAVEYAWLAWWQARGVEPAAFIGHSIGEYVAAVAAGVFSVEDGARLVAARGRLMQSAERGSMLAVQRPEAAVLATLPAALDIAVINAADSVVVAGPSADVDAYAEQLSGDGIQCTVLRTSHAFHSRMMQPVLEAFERTVASVERHPPTRPFVSSSTGDWIRDEQAVDPAYWSAHIRRAVRFHDGLTTVCSGQECVAIEAGPGQTLTTLFNQHAARGDGRWALASASTTADLDDEQAGLLALGRLWCCGHEMPAVEPDDAAPRVALPGYRFGGSEHWFRAPESGTAAGLPAHGAHSEERSTDPLDWARAESWALVASRRVADDEGPCILIADGGDVARVAAACPAADTRSRRALGADGYRGFVNELAQAAVPARLVYPWPSDVPAQAAYLDLVHLLQALARLDGVTTVRLHVLSCGALDVLQLGVRDPSAALALGACEVANKECSHLQCRLIDLDPDLDPDAQPGAQPDADTAQVIRALTVPGPESVLGVRLGKLWSRIEQPAPLSAPQATPASSGGVHVIVGGFGGIGQVLAQHLAGRGERVVLTHRPGSELSGDRAAFMQRLRESGADVQPLALALDDAATVQLSLASCGGKAGIAALYHLGGRTDDALLVTRDDASLLDVLAVKVDGSRVLASALSALPGRAPLVLFSSVAAWSGPVGQVDYAAANAWQMAFARSAPAGSHPVLAVAWPGWRNTGMVARIGNDAARQLALAHGLDAADGLALLDAALASGRESVWVSPFPLSMLDAPTPVQPRNRPARDASAGVPGDSGSAAPGDASGTTTQARVRWHWLELLGFAEIGADDNFFEIGGTSLVSVQVCGRLEREFGVPLAAEEMLGAPTIAELSALIERRLPDEPSPSADAAAPMVAPVDASGDAPVHAPVHASDDAPAEAPAEVPGARSLVPVAPGPGQGDALPVYLVHAHGGMVMGYQRLAQCIARSRPVFGLQSQGVRGDAVPLRDIEAMATRYAREIVARDPVGPYVLGGYCMGGTIAWEIARQLRSDGRPVALVFLLQSFHKDLEYPIVQGGRTAYPAHVGPWRRLTLVKDKAVEALSRHYRQADGPVAASLALLGGSLGRLRKTFDKRRRGTPLPPGLNSADNAALLDVHRANGEAFYRYEPGSLQAPVVFYPAEHQPRHVGRDALLGWDGLATGPVAVRPVPGSFLIGLDGLDLARVAEQLEQDLITALARITEPEPGEPPASDA